MKRCVAVFLLLFCASTIAAQNKVVGYLMGWKKPPSEEQVKACDIVGAGFLIPDGSKGEIKSMYSQSYIDSLVSMAKRNGVTVNAAFGGGDIPINETLMSIPEHRHRLISNLVDHVAKNNLDGIDNDWEPIMLDDEDEMFKINKVISDYYLIFTKELRDSLDSRFGAGKKILSASIFSKNEVYYDNPMYKDQADHFPKGFSEYLDFVSLMCYDDSLGKKHATTKAIFQEGGYVDHWIEQGIPKEKMVVGLAGYGRAAWQGVDAVAGYNKIIDVAPDLDSITDTLRYDFGSGTMLYGFNSQATVLEKQRLANEEGLYGVMLLSIDYDVSIDHPRSLLAVLSDYTAEEKSIKLTKPITRIVLNPVAQYRTLLSDHFSIESGTLSYSITNEPSGDRVEIVGDTLIVTAYPHSEIGVDNLTIRATNSSKSSEYIDHSIVLITDRREAVEKITSENLVKSDEWYTFGSDVFQLPEADADLRTRTVSGDTIISVFAEMIDNFKWNRIGFGAEIPGPMDITQKQLIIEYKSDLEMNNYNMTMSLVDTSGGYHVFVLTAKPGEWVRDTITTEKLEKAHLQPDSIDYSQIDSVYFNIGGGGLELHWNLQVKEFRYEPRSDISVITSADQKAQLFQMQSLKDGTLQFNYKVRSPHTLSIKNLQGRELATKSLSADLQSVRLSLPLSSGMYIAEIRGEEMQKAWKFSIQ